MALLARLVFLLPLVLALVSFVLTNLILFAGRQQGFMEDYAIVRLNTSMIGHDLFDGTKAKDKSKPKEGLLDELQDWWDDVKDDAKDKLNDITGGVADRITDRLGVSQWYSLHIMDACEGNFVPDPTAPNPGLNTTNCTTSSASYRLNLTELLDRELSVGPVKANLADIKWPESLQDKIDLVNDALLALFIVYVLCVGFTGLSLLLSAGAIVLPGKTVLVLANLVVASLGALVCAIGSIIVTVAGAKSVREINDRGQRVGVLAERGHKLITISWIATGLMLAVLGFWIAQLLMQRRKKAAKGQGEKAEREGEGE